jgi:drug/metabolite transporter (DMT)-like permease
LTTIVFLAVITAAVLHAVWNAIVKGGADKHLNMTALVLGNIPIAIVILPFVPGPAPESWPYLAAGIVLQVCYQLFLLAAYRVGDLTQVYPIARGIAPLLVAGVSVLFLGVHLDSIELIAVLTIGVGIISMSIVRRQDGLRNIKAVQFACLTGCFIAAYSLVDGMGARLAGTALGYYGWLAIGNAIVFAAIMEITRPGLMRAIPSRAKAVFIIGGNASFVAYAIVIWAFTQAPITLVTALRETGIIFALLIGVFFLKEKLDLAKVISVMVILTGVALLRLSKQ